MKKALGYIIVLVVIILLALPKLGLWGNKKGKGKGEGKNKMPVPVEVYVVNPIPLQFTLEVKGTLMANEEAELRAEVPGKITGIFFDEGKAATKGKTIVTIDDDEISATLRKTEKQLQLAGANEERAKSLLEKGGLSKQEYDKAKTDRDGLEEEVKRLKALKEKTAIKAPFGGTLGLREVSPGDYVTAGTLITRIVSTDPVKIEFSVPEQFAPAIKEGNTISFYTADRKEKMKANIYAVDPSIDNATRSLRARALCPNPKGKLLPGSFVTVSFNALNELTSLAVPTQAIVPVLKGQKLFLIKNGTAIEQKVETGFRNDTLITVVQGLKAGDTVAVNGVVQLKKDSKVIVKRVLNASATTNKP